MPKTRKDDEIAIAVLKNPRFEGNVLIADIVPAKGRKKLVEKIIKHKKDLIVEVGYKILDEE